MNKPKLQGREEVEKINQSNQSAIDKLSQSSEILGQARTYFEWEKYHNEKITQIKDDLINLCEDNDVIRKCIIEYFEENC